MTQVDEAHTPTALDKLIRDAACCACKGPFGERVNFVQLRRLATWKEPTTRNIMSGDGPCAVAAVCDECIAMSREIKWAVRQDDDGAYRLVDVSDLEELPPEPTCVSGIDRGSPWIKCLICGLTSWHPEDVKREYCSCCKQFHPIGR